MILSKNIHKSQRQIMCGSIFYGSDVSFSYKTFLLFRGFFFSWLQIPLFYGHFYCNFGVMYVPYQMVTVFSLLLPTF